MWVRLHISKASARNWKIKNTEDFEDTEYKFLAYGCIFRQGVIPKFLVKDRSVVWMALEVTSEYVLFLST